MPFFMTYTDMVVKYKALIIGIFKLNLYMALIFFYLVTRLCSTLLQPHGL